MYKPLKEIKDNYCYMVDNDGRMRWEERGDSFPQVWYIAEKSKNQWGEIFFPIVNGSDTVCPTPCLKDFYDNFKVGKCYLVYQTGEKYERRIDDNGDEKLKRIRCWYRIIQIKEERYDELAKILNRDSKRLEALTFPDYWGVEDSKEDIIREKKELLKKYPSVERFKQIILNK